MSVIPFRLPHLGPEPRPEESTRRESDLMARVVLGDTSALDALMKAFWGPLVGYASRLLDDTDVAQDVVQNVFVRLWASRAGWKPGSVRAYLFTFARNLALDELRSRKSRARLAWLGSRMRRVTARTPAELLEQQETGAIVDRAIQDLPARRREVFDLVYLRGLSYREVAESMHISPRTVSHQLSAALRQLRAVLYPLLVPSSSVGSRAADPAPYAEGPARQG